MHRFYAPIEIDPKECFSLDREQSRHLKGVLRMREGDEVKAFDMTGNEFLCLVAEFGSRDVTILRVIKQIEPPTPESFLELTLVPTLIKGAKFELVIQKAVELGVTTLAPIVTNRSDVKAKNIDKKLERWKKIIVESSKQCGRATLMEITAPQEFREFVGAVRGDRVLFYENSGERFSNIKAGKKITAVIGPEGGWDESEIEFALKKKFQIITLGGRILRAETASISIAALLQNHFGDLN